MAKKKKKRSKSRKSRSGGMFGINLNKLLGIGGGVYAASALGKVLPATWDSRLKAAAMVAVGEIAPKQDFVRGILKNDDLTNGAGNGLIAIGMQDLGAALNIPGMSGVGADDALVVAVEGIDDIELDDDMGDDYDDIDTVNEDVLSDDDLDVINDDVLADDDDIDTVNEDLDDDDDMDY